MSLRKPPVELDARSNICVDVQIGTQQYMVLTEVVANEFRLAFVFGKYEQFVVMNLSGHLVESISRNGSQLTINEYRTTPPCKWFSYTREGNLIGFYEAGFVAGAGDGLFGVCISKAERFPDFKFKLWVTDQRSFHLQLLQDSFVFFDASYATSVPSCKVYTGEQHVFRMSKPC